MATLPNPLNVNVEEFDHPTRGRAIRARRDLSPGMAIFEHVHPLPLIEIGFLSSDWNENVTNDWYGTQELGANLPRRRHANDLIRPAVNRLNDAQKDRFRTLYTLPSYLIRNGVDTTQRLRDVGIVAANSFEKSGADPHSDSDDIVEWIIVYDQISKINHSCVPNAILLTEDNLANIFAVKDILQGGEIFFNYMHESWLENTTDRRIALQTHWEFDCDCPDCGPSTAIRSKVYTVPHQHEDSQGQVGTVRNINSTIGQKPFTATYHKQSYSK